MTPNSGSINLLGLPHLSAMPRFALSISSMIKLSTPRQRHPQRIGLITRQFLNPSVFVDTLFYVVLPIYSRFLMLQRTGDSLGRYYFSSPSLTLAICCGRTVYTLLRRGAAPNKVRPQYRLALRPGLCPQTPH
jgi:hypothetical protein